MKIETIIKKAESYRSNMSQEDFDWKCDDSGWEDPHTYEDREAEFGENSREEFKEDPKENLEAELKEDLEVQELVRKLEEEERKEAKRLSLESEESTERLESKKDCQKIKKETGKKDISFFEIQQKFLIFSESRYLDQETTFQRISNPFYDWKSFLSWPEGFRNITSEHYTNLKKILSISVSYADLEKDGPFLLRLCLPLEDWINFLQNDCRLLLSQHDSRTFALQDLDKGILLFDTWKKFKSTYLKNSLDFEEFDIEEKSLEILQNQWKEYTTSWLLHEHYRRPLYRRRKIGLSFDSLNFMFHDLSKTIPIILYGVLQECGLYRELIGIVIKYIGPYRIQGRLWGSGTRVQWKLGEKPLNDRKCIKWLRAGKLEIERYDQSLFDQEKTDMTKLIKNMQKKHGNIFLELQNRGLLIDSLIQISKVKKVLTEISQ